MIRSGGENDTSPDGRLMLSQRRRRCSSIEPVLVQYVVLGRRGFRMITTRTLLQNYTWTSSPGIPRNNHEYHFYVYHVYQHDQCLSQSNSSLYSSIVVQHNLHTFPRYIFTSFTWFTLNSDAPQFFTDIYYLSRIPYHCPWSRDRFLINVI